MGRTSCSKAGLIYFFFFFFFFFFNCCWQEEHHIKPDDIPMVVFGNKADYADDDPDAPDGWREVTEAQGRAWCETRGIKVRSVPGTCVAVARRYTLRSPADGFALKRCSLVSPPLFSRPSSNRFSISSNAPPSMVPLLLVVVVGCRCCCH